MKRIMLATTAAVALATPSFADGDINSSVRASMVGLGYDAAIVDGLSTAEVTELHMAFTSDDQTRINAAIDGLELAVDEVDTGLVDTPRSDDTRAVVRAALMQNGMAPGLEKLMTDGEYTELFLAASTGDVTRVNQVIAALDFEMDEDGQMLINSSAERRVASALEVRGVTDTQLDMINDAEMAEIFFALTGDDETALNAAIASALNS